MALELDGILPLAAVAAAAFLLLRRKPEGSLDGSAGGGLGDGYLGYNASGGPIQSAADLGAQAQGASGPGGQIPVGMSGSTLFGAPTFSTMQNANPGRIPFVPNIPAIVQTGVVPPGHATPQTLQAQIANLSLVQPKGGGGGSPRTPSTAGRGGTGAGSNPGITAGPPVGSSGVFTFSKGPPGGMAGPPAPAVIVPKRR